MESKVDEMIRMQQSELERISSLTRDEAKQIILERVENELSHDIAIMTKETENRAKEEADKKAKNILSLALQRCAADHVAETTVSVVNLPNDEMKGRIIGREGRNIRTLETLTGIDLIIDDTLKLSFFPDLIRSDVRQQGLLLINSFRMAVFIRHGLKKWLKNLAARSMTIFVRWVSKRHLRLAFTASTQISSRSSAA